MYTFAFRTYNPMSMRWMTVDRSDRIEKKCYTDSNGIIINPEGKYI